MLEIFPHVVRGAFLQGVLKNSGVLTWCFCGSFVVKDW
jgi:hypothetical protein